MLVRQGTEKVSRGAEKIKKEKMSFSVVQSDQIADSDSSLLSVRHDPQTGLIACSSECGSVFILNSRLTLGIGISIKIHSVKSVKN